METTSECIDNRRLPPVTIISIHSFTLFLREQLKSTSVKVVEIIPPAVKTNLGRSHDFGEELNVCTRSVLKQLEAGVLETTLGISAPRVACRAPRPTRRSRT
jgi:uncharacterized oxidoreductase